MRVFDCFMYYNEDTVLELRLNYLDQFVDYFVIVESTFTHDGKKRELKFNIEKFNKFKKKIIYLTYDVVPKGIEIINDNDTENEKARKKILNAIKRENGQRNYISNGLKLSDEKDLILISDVDEIPNLSNINFTNFKNKIIQFKQKMFYYKFNLILPNIDWVGTKGCRKKYLQSPQWLRNVKDRKYPFYRIDTYFSDKKYNDILFIKEGGWHFTNIKTPEQIKYKLSSYLHHIEFEENPLSLEEIEKIVKEKKAIYNLSLDKRANKIGVGNELEKYDINKLPVYIKQNIKIFEKWLD